MNHFPDTFKVKIDKKAQKVILSIKVSDTKVETFIVPLADFVAMIAQFKDAQRKAD